MTTTKKQDPKDKSQEPKAKSQKTKAKNQKTLDFDPSIFLTEEDQDLKYNQAKKYQDATEITEYIYLGSKKILKQKTLVVKPRTKADLYAKTGKKIRDRYYYNKDATRYYKAKKTLEYYGYTIFEEPQKIQQ